MEKSRIFDLTISSQICNSKTGHLFTFSWFLDRLSLSGDKHFALRKSPKEKAPETPMLKKHEVYP